MVAGFWLNQDGLPLQFGTQKAIEEVGGDYLVYGETREFEQLIPLVPMSIGSGTTIQVPAPPTTFSGTGFPAAAGIQSLTNIFPLQITPVTTVSGGILNFTTTQLFIEQVELDTIIAAAGGTSIACGLAFVLPGTPSSTFVQVTPNAGTQLIKNATAAAAMATTGMKTYWNLPGATGVQSGAAANNTIAGGGDWLGTVPLVTNAVTPLPSKAYVSTIATGAFTNGLVKLRVRYTLYGSISQ
jgi:hypothetical protein